MKKKSQFVIMGRLMGFCMMFSMFIVALNSCGGSKTNETTKASNVDDEAFYATQPVHSGLYEADYYEIVGTNSKKGHFDGRIYFSLSPETSAFYVFENGNRTKINYIVNLQHPFEKNDSGVYTTVDTKDRLVCVTPDTAFYSLKFQRSGEEVTVNFNPKPRHTGSALEILEKMSEQRNKK